MSYGQGGPAWVPGGSQQPDWNALAADAERRQRRRRGLLVGGGAVGALAVGTVVALLIVGQGGGGGGDNASGDSSTLPAEPSGSSTSDSGFEPTQLPPLPEPSAFISDAEMDVAAFEPETFFSGEGMEFDGRAYTQVATDAAEGCPAEIFSGDLSAALTELECGTTLRATFTGEGVAVTVGVAQFPTVEAAEQVRGAADGNLAALTGGGAPAFCQNGGCRTTTNQVGRYAYFTIAGNADGTPDSGDGTAAQQASRDGNDHAFDRIIQRGETQASASASAIVEERRRSQEENGG
ncbi:hypothetical protein [Streptomyces avicenniae]|uniref:hypothetical protein n=1 Tax=Streptomyces avicenniae TaxID=500153 RepID=UPI0006994703|nr:hypothetical protein [Streptomyces avicenniae]